jgi:hypothetical protein
VPRSALPHKSADYEQGTLYGTELWFIALEIMLVMLEYLKFAPDGSHRCSQLNASLSGPVKHYETEGGIFHIV